MNGNGTNGDYGDGRMADTTGKGGSAGGPMSSDRGVEEAARTSTKVREVVDRQEWTGVRGLTFIRFRSVCALFHVFG